MPLVVRIINDASGTPDVGNYAWAVFVDIGGSGVRDVCARGRVEGHRREDGWLALLERVVEAAKEKSDGK